MNYTNFQILSQLNKKLEFLDKSHLIVTFQNIYCWIRFAKILSIIFLSCNVRSFHLQIEVVLLFPFLDAFYFFLSNFSC